MAYCTLPRYYNNTHNYNQHKNKYNNYIHTQLLMEIHWHVLNWLICNDSNLLCRYKKKKHIKLYMKYLKMAA